MQNSTDTDIVWSVNLPPGNVTFKVEDGAGDVVYSDPWAILPSNLKYNDCTPILTFEATATSYYPIVTVTSSQPTAAASSGPSTSQLIGTVVGVIVGLFALLIVILLLYRRHRRKQKRNRLRDEFGNPPYEHETMECILRNGTVRRVDPFILSPKFVIGEDSPHPDRDIPDGPLSASTPSLLPLPAPVPGKLMQEHLLATPVSRADEAPPWILPTPRLPRGPSPAPSATSTTSDNSVVSVGGGAARPYPAPKITVPQAHARTASLVSSYSYDDRVVSPIMPDTHSWSAIEPAPRLLTPIVHAPMSPLPTVSVSPADSSPRSFGEEQDAGPIPATRPPRYNPAWQQEERAYSEVGDIYDRYST